MSLRIYPVILELIREVRERYLPRIQAEDPDLARQMRRALCSMSLNTGEGMHAQGGNRRARYFTAKGSAREVLSCLETAFAMGYIPEIDSELRGKFDHVLGTLVNLVKPRAR
jgi:four helix bundle protein